GAGGSASGRSPRRRCRPGNAAGGLAGCAVCRASDRPRRRGSTQPGGAWCRVTPARGNTACRDWSGGPQYRRRQALLQQPCHRFQHNRAMDLPVMPPVSPMLAKPVRSIPPDASYEPKWDGFRTICFRDRDEVELGSRNERPMTRYFPELVAAALAELPERCVVDGEIVLPNRTATGSSLDFEALQL